MHYLFLSAFNTVHFKEFIWNTFTESHFENVLKVVLLLLFIFVSLHLFSKHSFFIINILVQYCTKTPDIRLV